MCVSQYTILVWRVIVLPHTSWLLVWTVIISPRTSILLPYAYFKVYFHMFTSWCFFTCVIFWMFDCCLLLGVSSLNCVLLFVWQDRILFRSRKKNTVACLCYDAVMSMCESDHKPVFGIYEVFLRPGVDTWAFFKHKITHWVNVAY